MVHTQHTHFELTLCFQCYKLATPTAILRLRTKDSTIQQMRIIADAPTEAQRKQHRTLYGLSENYNPLFQLDVDFTTKLNAL